MPVQADHQPFLPGAESSPFPARSGEFDYFPQPY
jgi:hypothetical protein